MKIMNQTHLSRKREQGFTLIELLVVMAITTILLGLIFGPLVQGFNLTNRARVQVLSQDTARRVMEIGQRAFADGVFVFDNSNRALVFWVRDKSGNPAPVNLPYSVVDFVPPAHVNDQNASVKPGDIDPTTGLPRNRGDIALPVAPGRLIDRWFIGLKNNSSMHDGTLDKDRPVKVYGNYYDDNRVGLTLNDHNPALLYRATFSPYLPSGALDTRLINLKGGARSLRDALNDPNFFYDNDVAPAAVDGWEDLNRDTKVNYSENWAAIARAMVPSDRADEVTLQRNDKGRILYDSTTGLPRVIAQARFQPTYVGNDAGQPTASNDTGNAAVNISPSAYITSSGHWTYPYNLILFRSKLTDAVLDYFFVKWMPDGSGRLWHQQYDTVTGTYPVDEDANFDLDGRGQLLTGRQPKIMFAVDPRRGAVNMAFPDSLLLHDSMGNPQPSRFYPHEANWRFDSTPVGSNQYRYVSLAYLDPPMGFTPPGPVFNSGVMSPLKFDMADILKTYIPNVRIVPGSDGVRGPDMNPGPHYGQEITYTRVADTVTPQEIGPNEYKINYINGSNLKDPTNMQQRVGTIIFNSRPEFRASIDGVDYLINALPEKAMDPVTGLLTAPAAPITVTYQIQNNLPNDIVRADYLTRQLMTFSLGVRLYDLNSGQPQQVTLTQKVKVRNLQR